LSAKKRIRQNIKRRERNRVRKSVLKTVTRKFTDAVSDRDVDGAKTAFSLVTRLIDKNAAKKTLHKNTAARKKSRLAKRLNKLVAVS